MQPPWRTVWRLLKTLKVEVPYDPGIPLLGIYPERTETLSSKRYMHPMFIPAFLAIAKTWKQPKCPVTDENG